VTRAGVLAGVAAVLLLVATPAAWSRSGAATRSEAGSPPVGQVLFRTKGCASCHDGPDTQAGRGFPDLADARAWAGMRRPGLDASEYLRESIRDPSTFRSPAWSPGGAPPGMPQLMMSESETAAIVAYLLAR
jgi:mono/diheme cytochrome c family protein